jgi:hypothetical protein
MPLAEQCSTVTMTPYELTQSFGRGQMCHGCCFVLIYMAG